MKIGIFDSGIGGEAVAMAFSAALPSAQIITVNDRANLPYGSRTHEEIQKLTEAAIQPLLAKSCDVIVIACNTATAASIDILRERYPKQLFIGLEPMIKPAVEVSKSGIIAVCATPATLASQRYQMLKQQYAKDIFVIEPDCRNWASMIEHEQIDEYILKNTIDDICEQGADAIVLACTHYHWISDLITKIVAGRATVLEPSEAIAERVSKLLESR